MHERTIPVPLISSYKINQFWKIRLLKFDWEFEKGSCVRPINLQQLN